MKKISLFCFIMIFFCSNNAFDNSFQWRAHSKPFEVLRKSIRGHALLKNDWLNHSVYYQVFKTKKDALACDNFKRVVFCSDKNSCAVGYFLNRNSDKVVMIVPPYGADISHVVRYAAIFQEYDVLILEYATHNHSGFFSQLYSFVTALCPQRLEKGYKQIQLALEWLQKKNYSQVIGCGQSYGSWLVLHTQQDCKKGNKPGFDRLIIDSCPAGARQLRQKFIEDPVAVATFGQKKGSSYLTAVTNASWVKQFFMSVSERFFSDISIEAILKDIAVPILFVHGSGDLLVDNEQFEKMYDAVSHTQKYALLTPYKHLHHSLKAKELYRHLALNFINKSFE